MLRDHLRRFSVFGAVGAVNTLVGYGVIITLHLLQVPFVIANGMGYLAGFLLGYALHRQVTFRARATGGDHRSRVLVAAACLVGSSSLAIGLAALLAAGGVPSAIASAAGVGVNAVLYYLALSRFCYR